MSRKAVPPSRRKSVVRAPGSDFAVLPALFRAPSQGREINSLSLGAASAIHRRMRLHRQLRVGFEISASQACNGLTYDISGFVLGFLSYGYWKATATPKHRVRREELRRPQSEIRSPQRAQQSSEAVKVTKRQRRRRS